MKATFAENSPSLEAEVDSQTTEILIFTGQEVTFALA